jgi:3D (Asp-Asp-Asp) domain-containing protein
MCYISIVQVITCTDKDRERSLTMGLKKGLITCAAFVGFLFAGTTAASASENNSVVDYLAARGEDYSFGHRGELAAQYGIAGYRGTAVQNLTLLEKLRGSSSTSQTPVAQAATSTPTAQPKETPQAQAKPSGKTFTANASAYTANCSGCSGITATGINLKANPNQKVIAVDPNVIPLGSRVYVEGYGTAIAADTGGAIKGNRIDLYMQNYSDAITFGRRTVQVTVLN